MISWLAKLLNSFHHAIQGIWYALRTQRNMRIHMAATIASIVLGLYQGLHSWEWCCLCITIALVWMAEIFNSAMECLCDRITTEEDPQIAKIKDMSAGAVLIMALSAVGVAFIIFC
ncbi:diacylglycerol kinase (ATP) [Prosthecobacter fusiformis]|uniref:Diacylglycerol kinase (ATP) n=1 Tax=Prosthecobacter fusiformis TaxID=48464 RepID=A0A4R7RNM6_9BACT|nr:diacylglycerol kinase family protein [Prosthecobacter fusiformis]TDU64654.1 diacylglycerol kinase (ATP) [Prosthecobacter fusiformis]